MFVQIKLIRENNPGPKWQQFFIRVWPFYKKWFLSEGYLKRPGYMTSVEALEQFMPELMPFYEQLVEQAGGGDLEARFLSMYCPPPYMSGCSQMAVTGMDTALIRNYDYHPRLFDGKLMYTNWLQPVMGMSDCTWGLLDGMNGSGLAASLTFGGRKTTGVGFGIPIIMRYVLETCKNVHEAIEALVRIPVHMSYNVTVIDKSQNFATVYLSPDRAANVVFDPVCTNHQYLVEWEEYGVFANTIARKTFMTEHLLNKDLSLDQKVVSFFAPPLYNNQYEKYFGTLYTAVYNLKKEELTLAWPRKKETMSFDKFEEKTIQVKLDKHVSNHLLS